jgi:TolB-like protein
MKHLLATLLLLSTAQAATIAVLEITIADNDEIDFSIDETKFLSDELRRQATVLLPKDDSVFTREEIISLAQQTTEDLGTVLNIGRAIKSDYVTQGLISKIGGIFTLTVELYETSSGKLLGYFTKESPDLKGFLEVIRENAPNIFAKIMPKEEPPIISIPETVKDTQLTAIIIPTNIPAEPEKSKNSFWIALGLDLVGAALIGGAVYENSRMNVAYKEYKERGNSHDYYEDAWEKAKSHRSTRNTLYVIGGLVLVSGIGVHIQTQIIKSLP